MPDKSLFDNEKAITAGIVTYNNADEIEVLMRSLQSCSSFAEMTVYVIDNASRDDTMSLIRARYPWARIVENRENLGFGRAHNLVISNIRSRFHIMINPDVSFPVDTISKAVEYLDRNPDVAVVTPYVMNADGTQQFLPKRNPSMKYLIGGLLENRFLWAKKLRDEYTMKGRVITRPIDVEFCTGAFLCTRTEALHQVGGFDERYFLHFEDADLTRKLRTVGRAVYHPDIKVTHKWHRDNKKINKSTLAALRSMFIYMIKWRGK